MQRCKSRQLRDGSTQSQPRPFKAQMIFFWALPMGCETGRQWNSRETCLLTPWPYTVTSPPCFGFYSGLVLSSNKWLALGRRGDRDPEDPDGEHSPTLPFSCAPDPQDRPDLSQFLLGYSCKSLGGSTASCLCCSLIPSGTLLLPALSFWPVSDPLCPCRVPSPLWNVRVEMELTSSSPVIFKP